MFAKLQTLVYDILLPTTSIVDYAIGLEKLSANEQFFDDVKNGSDNCKLQALVYDILLWRKVPESDARSVW